MYKTIITSILLWFGGNIYACNICGCSAGGNYFGILPKFQQNFVGIRYQYRSIYSDPIIGSSEKSGRSQVEFKSAELWGRYVVNKRLQFYLFVPFNSNSSSETNKSTKVNGIGDISIIANIVAINSDSSCNKFKHLLQIGGGIKAATGKHDIVRKGLMLDQNIQPGSGSIDFPLNVIYTVKYKQFGLNSEMNYSINYPNDQHFKFGNRFSSSLRLLYYYKTSQFIALPSLGFAFESNQDNRIENKIQNQTGGQSILGNVGLDFYYRNIGLTIALKKPIIESMGGGNLHNGNRISTNFIYLF